MAVAIAGCGESDSGEVTGSDKPAKPPAAKKAKPLDRAVKRLEGAGYEVTRDSSDAQGVVDSLEVTDGKMNFDVAVYGDAATAKKNLAALHGVATTNPEQIALLQDATRPEILATGTIEKPAKLPVSRFLKLAELSIQTDPVEVAKLETGGTQAAAKPKAKPKPKPKPKAAPAEESGGSITVPNVVGKDHQLAQDEMQAAGLYLLQEEDCTGQDRLLVYDRNWTVVSQKPAGGSTADEDTTITLCSKKDGE